MKTKKILTITKIFLSILFLFIFHFSYADVATTTATSTDSITIHLQIEGSTATLFSSTITVSACEAVSSTTPTVNAYCAIKQSGVDNTWSLYGDDQFVDSIGGVSNDYVNNIYWGWFSNLEYGETSLNKHALSSDEELLVNFGRMPLKISVSTTTPEVNGTTTVSVSEFGFDSFWNGVWLSSASSSIDIYETSFSTDTNGNYDLLATSTDSFSIKATKSGFLDSSSIIISPVISPEIESATTTTEIVTSSSSSAGSGGGTVNNNVVTHNNIDTSKAFQFLLDNQKSDGSFGYSLYTDWAAIAFALGSQNSGKEKIINYLKCASDTSANITDYERHAMALMALGINPYSGTSVNYIQKIVNSFDGNQIGDVSLVNDDVFAIFPLIKAGYSSGDPIIQKIVAYIISKQNSDGSWVGGIDMTAATIQALSMTPSISGVNQALDNARTYLSTGQQSNGGFGSSFSTSWALQAIASLGESGTNWLKNNNNPYDYLYSTQQSDGGLEALSQDINTRLWATVYAIPASLNKPWSVILSSFSKPVDVVNDITTDVALNVGETSTTTLILEATSTVLVSDDLALVSKPIELTVLVDADKEKKANDNFPVENEKLSSVGEILNVGDVTGTSTQNNSQLASVIVGQNDSVLFSKMSTVVGFSLLVVLGFILLML
ncbi:MAG: terpene cyclase/mutase family protein [Parcubacteria group bacterium]|nr:terpene cyclase/mutase family protein [Parcubacteria group bacterium]